MRLKVTIIPVVEDSIFEMAPSFRAISLAVSSEGLSIEDASETLEKAFEDVANGIPEWSSGHLEAWAQVFRVFGAKPQRTPCSVAAMRKRVEKSGSLPSINPIVDLYNAVSLQYAIPVGGEDYDRYSGVPRLIRADGTEVFDTNKNGSPSTENPDEGEVVWCDDKGVTCRRWNWRQGTRTQISPDSKNMWFILERLDPMPEAMLQEAADTLIAHLESALEAPKITLTHIGNT